MTLDASELAPIDEEVAEQPEAEPQAATDPAPVAQAEEPDPTEGLQEVAEQVAALKAALTQARGQLREAKPLAQKASQLESQLNELRPYVDFVKANPQLLQPQQPAAPQAPPDLNTDPQLVAYAKRFDLYTADGKPDVERAKAIVDDNRKIAEEAAAKHVEPLIQQSNEHRAAANLTNVLAMKDGDGNPLQPQFIEQAVKSLAQGTDQVQLIRMLADPKVASVIGNVALGLQAQAPRQKVVAPPAGDPLHVEIAGGRGGEYTMGETEKRIARAAKVDEKAWTAQAKKFNPNGPNSFE